MRPPSHQPRPHLRRPSDPSIAALPPRCPDPPRIPRPPHSCAPPPPRPLRHSCAGRNPCDHHRINQPSVRPVRRPRRVPVQTRGEYRHADPSFPHPPSVIPAPPSVIPAPPSVIPAQAGIHATTIASTTPAPSDGHPDPSFPAPPPSFSAPALRHSCAPLRHSCAGRNPCDHHRINHARTFRRPPRSVIPAPPDPSFLRPLRHSCAPSVIPAQAGIHATTIASTTPAPSDGHAVPSFPHPPSVIPAPPSVIPAPPPSFLRPPPSFLRRQESMRPPSHQLRPHLPTALRSLNRRASSSLQWDPPTLIPLLPLAGGAAAACPAQAGG